MALPPHLRKKINPALAGPVNYTEKDGYPLGKINFRTFCIFMLKIQPSGTLSSCTRQYATAP